MRARAGLEDGSASRAPLCLASAFLWLGLSGQASAMGPEPVLRLRSDSPASQQGADVEQMWEQIERRLREGRVRDAERLLKQVWTGLGTLTDRERYGSHARELARQCVFERHYTAPPVETLLGATSGSWNRRSGRLRLRFDARSAVRQDAPVRDAALNLSGGVSPYSFHPQGFVSEGGLLMFEVPFRGGCQMSVEGVLPEHAQDRKRPPTLSLSGDAGLAYTVDYTWPSTYRKSKGLWSQGVVYGWDGGQSELLDTDRTPGGKYDMMWGEPYTLKLVVKSTRLVASLQGYGMVSVPKDKGLYGRLGFRWCPFVREIHVSGLVDPEQMDRRWARHRERAWELFRTERMPMAPLPTWLMELISGGVDAR